MRAVHRLTRITILRLIDIFYPPFRFLMPMQTFRYAVCGGGNMVLDILLYSLSYNFLFHHQPVNLGFYTLSAHIAALLVSFTFTFPIGFYLSRYVVWQQLQQKKRVQLLRYLVVVAICVVLNIAFIKLFVDGLHLYPTIAKVLTTVVVTAFSYLSQKSFSFKN
jgi:putative flippase GtrA